MKAIILAGGGGARLWPLSRRDFPKQFLYFEDHESLLQKTVRRCLESPLIEEIIISINKEHELLVRQQLCKIGSKLHIVVEPERKNTAPAIALAVKYIEEKIGRAEPILVLPSDHLIEPQSVFNSHLEHLSEVVKFGKIALFGIAPTKPETGYGYIQIGEKFGLNSYKVKRFVEKPDVKKAEEFIASGNYYWNAGIFAFSIETFWKEMRAHAPKVASLEKGSFEENVKQFYMLNEISIDYAVIEKSLETVVCPLPVAWSDVGSWDSVYESMQKDENKNVKRGNVHDIDTKRSLILGKKKLIATIGLEDMLIVESDDAIFISKKGESQRVKELVQELIRTGKMAPSAEVFPLVHALFVRRWFPNALLRALNWLLRLYPFKKPPMPEAPRKILLSNIASLGDVVISTVVLPVLKEKYPGCEIGFLTSSSSKVAIQDHPLISKVHLFDHAYLSGSILQHIKSRKRALREIRREKYDLAIDLYSYFPNAIPLLAQAKIPVRIGYTSGGFSTLLTHPVPWEFSNEYVGSAHLRLLQLEGSPLPDYNYGAPKTGRIVIHMGSSNRLKNWISSLWTELIEKLEKLGVEIVLTGKGDEVVERAGVKNLINQLNWSQFVQEIQGARLLITVDSVSVHLAAASLTPTIVLSTGLSSPSMWRPPYPGCHYVMNPVPCAPCFKKKGCSTMKCIRGITVDEVYKKVVAILSAGSSKNERTRPLFAKGLHESPLQ